MFGVGFADLAQEQALEAGKALAVIGPHLGQEPVRFAAATSAAVADGGGTIGLVTKTGGGAGAELALLEDQASGVEVGDLVLRAAGAFGGFELFLEPVES